MRQGWETKTLGKVIKLEYGKPLPKEDRDNEGEYPAYGANGVKCRTNRFYWEKPSIIVGRKGSAGEIALIADRFWPLDVTYFVTFDEREYDLVFLFHCLNSLQLTKLAKGVKPGINRNDVYQLIFSFPPLPEQKHIVAILDEAFAGIDKAIANTQKNLTNARELFESFLETLFLNSASAETLTTLDGMSELIIDCEHKTAPKQELGFPSIRTPNIGKGHLILEGVNRVSKKNYEQWTQRGKPIAGDLILAREAPAGNVGVVPEGEIVCLGQRTVLIRPKVKIANSKYLAYLLLHPIIQSRLLSKSTGAIVPHINMKDIRGLPLANLPSLKDQKYVVKKFENLRTETQRLESLYQQKLDALAELKQSLLQKAFTGELTNDFIAEQVETIDTTSPAFTANVICLSHHLHEKKKREKTFGRVKAQKDLHLVESIGGIDLGRQPIKDAAGPNDSAHMRRAQDWAKQQQFFEFVKRPNGRRGHTFKKLARYKEMKSEALAMIKPYSDSLENITNLLIQKDTEQAEVFTTVHTAWNNLIIDGSKITQKAILHEAGENWHIDKLKIPLSKFKAAITEIKQKNLQPDGTAKYVGKLEEELF